MRSEAAAREIWLVGKKLDENKPRWTLLPWRELEQVVMTLNFGAKKYGVDNWKKVQNGERRYQDAALRHVVAVMSGEDKDPETGLSSYAHAIASLTFAYWHSRNKQGKA